MVPAPVPPSTLLHVPWILRGYLAATARIPAHWVYWERSAETGKGRFPSIVKDVKDREKDELVRKDKRALGGWGR